MTKLVKEKNFFQIQCEKKSIVVDEDGILIEGYASTKDKDRGHDIVEPTAFKSALDLYMTNPIVLLQHNPEKPIGLVNEARIDDKGLYIKAKITEDEDGIFSKLKNGVIRAFSIGYRVKDFEDKEVKDADGMLVSYETVIKDLELFEISLVSIPMNQYALMKSMSDCFEKDENPIDTDAEIQDTEENVEADKNISEEKEQALDENTDTMELEKTDEENAVIESEEVVEEKTDDIEAEIQEDGAVAVEVKEEEIEADNVESTNDENELLESNDNAEAELVEEDKVEEEVKEIPNEEAETQEICEEVSDDEIKSEIPNLCEEADENSEIVEEVEADQSENADETTANDEAVIDEISNNEPIIEKAVEIESTKALDFEEKKFQSIDMELKSMKEIIASKDEEIKSLDGQLQKQKELLIKFADCLDEMDSKMNSTIIQTGFAYQTPVKRKSAYADLIRKIQQ